jgi:PAS domain S-box-containing protein
LLRLRHAYSYVPPQHFPDDPLMSKKILGIFCIVPLSIFLGAAIVYVKSDAGIQRATHEHHRLVCAAVAQRVDEAFSLTRQLALLAASMPAIVNATGGQNLEQARALLTSLQEQRGEALTPTLSLLDNKGTVLASPVFTTPQAGSAFFQEALQGRCALQEPENAQDANGASLLFAAPVARNTRIVGVLVAHLDLSQLALNILPILRDAGMEHSFAFALDSAGRLLMHANFAGPAGPSIRDEPWTREIPHKKHGQIAHTWAGTPRIAIFTSLPESGWVVGISSREEDLLGPQRGIRNWFLGGTLGVAALALLALCLLSRESRFHLRAGSALALAEFAAELKQPSGERPEDQAHILHLGLSAALEKIRHKSALLEHEIAIQRGRRHAIFASMTEGLLHVNADGVILYANPSILRMLHCREQDILGRRAPTVLLPPVALAADNGSLFDVHMAMGASHSQAFSGKILRRQDGSHLLANIVVHPLHMNGKADGALFIIRDVSLVDALRQLLSAVTHAVDAIYFVWDEQGRLVDCGDNCTTVLLAPSKEEVLRNFTRFMPERQANGRVSAEELELHLARALNDGNDACDWLFANEPGATTSYELVFRRFTQCGRPAVLGLARETRLVPEKAATELSQLKHMLDALPVAVGVIGRGTILYANREMAECIAQHGDEPALAPFSPAQSASFDSELELPQTPVNKSLQLFKPDGTPRDYMLLCFPMEFDGTAALAGCLVDVTHLKSEEQRLTDAMDVALETVEANRHLLSHMEREIREALDGILFALQQAMRTSEAEQHQAVNAAHAFGVRLRDTLSHMLNASGEPSPDPAREITRFEVADFFYEVLHSFADEAEAKGITFDSRLDPKLPKTLVGNRTLLRLIITQLVGNAVQYTAVGGVTVDVALLPFPKANKAVLYVTVTDTGLGMSDTQLSTLFRSFPDDGQSASLPPGNARFGLAVARSHVHLLEGELCAISETGQGTEIHLVLPFALNLPEESLFSETAEEESLPFLQGALDSLSAQNQDAAKGRILVVDDIPANMRIMVLILQKMGYEASGADSGEKALNMLEKTPFDLVFLDIQMPRMDGMEVASRIRNNEDGRYPRDIPIVAMTAHAMVGDPEKYLAAGMNDYISKPVLVEDITNILNAVLKR